MATLTPQENDTGDWKQYPGSSDFSGIAQNLCDNALYLYVTATGQTPAEAEGVVLKAGVGEYIPVIIDSTETLHFKPLLPGKKVTMRLG